MGLNREENLNRSGVYLLQNKINNKVYIGQSKNINQRYKKHKSVATKDTYRNIILYRAMRKYGVENFQISVLEYCDKSELDEIEFKYIKKYDSANINKGYNMVNYMLPNVPYLKLNENTLKGIRKDLSECLITKSYMETKYNISRSAINMINNGISYFDETIDYPIRKISEVQLKEKFKKRLRQCKCKDCNRYYTTNKDNRRNKYCSVSCYRKETGKRKPTKEILYKMLVESKSFTYTAKQLGVSDKSVIKYCKGYGLPHKIKYYKNR